MCSDEDFLSGNFSTFLFLDFKRGIFGGDC